MSYDVLLHPDANEFIESLDDKSRRIVRKNLRKLGESPCRISATSVHCGQDL
ncbi:MAG: hypothetical protein MAG715_00991 [Methanonatronarchaeales archaeon]|nr:hypothetical protein [Methanonatronarchaeales archaeon]